MKYTIIGIEKSTNKNLNGAHLNLLYRDKNVKGVPIKKVWLNDGVFPTDELKLGMNCKIKIQGYYARNIFIVKKDSIFKRVLLLLSGMFS